MKNREFRLLQLFAEDPAGGQDGEIPKGQDEGSKDQKKIRRRQIQSPLQNTQMKILTGCSTRSLQK